MRNLLLVFLLFLLAVGGVARLAWQRTGHDRYAALVQEGLGLARILKGAALEAQVAVRTAEEALALRLLSAARRIDDALARTRGPSAPLLQNLAEEEGVGRVFLFDAEFEPVARARTPAPLPAARDGLITAEQKADLEWTRAATSVRKLRVAPGEHRVEGLQSNVFGTRDRFGVAFGRSAGGVLLLRAAAEEIAALRRTFGVEPLLERAVELPDVTAVQLVEGVSAVVAAPLILLRGDTLRVMEPLDEVQGVWLELRLSSARADAAVQASRRGILWGAGAALLVAVLALGALQRMETRYQRARADAAARLEEERRLAEMGALTGLLTHELSNPLNALRLGVRLLSDSDDEEERAAVLETMRTESDRVTRRLEEFLRFAGDHAARRERVDASLLDRVAARVRSAARQGGVSVLTEAASGSPAAVGDPVVLEEALLNLVRNAVEASPVEGTVRLAWSAGPKGAVQIRIADDGPGFPGDPAELLRLGTARPRRGHGLGLVLARRFVEGHGGRIVLSNRKSGGACAEVQLPAWEA